ncbi:hypothetical protein [Marivita hallyeonensis]|uniref:Hpt domain-containing protein n=1 Tax=Marivita hallyeonensis TaxID=996342 RepID=A0A1M5TT41_9RHOB|nr:hypothetical protein [Marivita hallyeonensis]SHH53985.1 hypothetical protein SAMN05443551_2355 [Marivita hallyeonensis]
MVEQISILHPHDTAFFDEDTLNALSRDLGPNVAENILCRALEDMAARLNQIRDEYSEGNETALRKSVRSLIPIAEQIGLPAVSSIARDVLICVDRGEGVSIAATLCRLLRSGELAISCADLGMDLSV